MTSGTTGSVPVEGAGAGAPCGVLSFGKVTLGTGTVDLPGAGLFNTEAGAVDDLFNVIVVDGLALGALASGFGASGVCED